MPQSTFGIVAITVTPAGTGTFQARLRATGDIIVRNSEQPFLDAARALVRRGADPSGMLEMWHAGAQHHALRAPIGVAAALAVEQRTNGKPPRFVPYRPFNRAAVAPRNEEKHRPVGKRPTGERRP